MATSDFTELFDSYSVVPKRYNYTAAKVQDNGLLNRADGTYTYGDPIIAFMTASNYHTFFRLPQADTEVQLMVS